jgi:RNA polymerase sigma-70 factor (ECF subfamily)
MAITPADDPGMALHLEKDRQLEMMNDCLQELVKEQKQCVTLFYLEKRSYNEIADHTGFTLLQVKSYIQNGKRNLKILLERKLNQS